MNCLRGRALDSANSFVDAFTSAMSNPAYPQSETASPELTQNVDTVIS
jgi:hypothetical protein